MQNNDFQAKVLLKKIPWLLSGPFFYLLFRLSSLWPGFTENVYSRTIYSLISQGLSTFTGLLPFSLGEILLYGFILFIIVYMVLMFIRAVTAKRSWWFILINRTLIFLSVVSCIYALFIGLWGFNYSRNTLGNMLSLDTSPAKLTELYSTCDALLDKANELRSLVPENENGVFSPVFTRQDMMNSVSSYYDMAAKETKNNFLGGSYGPVKPVIYSTGLSYAHISGIYFPFTGEANINIGQPMLFFPSSCLHEAAHQRGFAREDEANFLAFYVSQYSDDVSVEYSGTMLALVESMNKLYEQDKDSYFKLRKKYSEGIGRDLHFNYLYWQNYESPVKETSKAVNNTFLQANMQADGVKSYGRMVDLLIALWRSGGL